MTQFIKPTFNIKKVGETGKILHGAAAVRKDRILGARSIDAQAAEIQDRETGTFTADASQIEVKTASRAEVALDDTQMSAVQLCLDHQYAIIGGYAGTGKTTTMQKVVTAVAQDLSQIDWTYFRSAGDATGPETRPAIAMCCTTNMAARNLASKLPVEWANHCMSIHSLLAFAPVGQGEIDFNTGREVTRFEPRYNATNKMPIEVLFIDEAGQVPVDLWQMVLDAARPDLRIYFLGDLAQLRPTHGHSPMTFALEKWPSIILDKIYRQKEGSALLDQITRIRRGLHPQHDGNHFRCGNSEKLPDRASEAGRLIEGYVGYLYRNKLFDPMQDIILTAENDADLGQRRWNMRFQPHFNPERRDATGKVLNPPVPVRTALGMARYRVGDKVMATDNGGRRATERRFVNGSLGVIVKIEPNPAYKGDVSDALYSADDIIDMDETDLGDDEALGVDADPEALKALQDQIAMSESEDIRRRSASHIIHVRELSTGEDYALSSSAEIQSLQFGYATTANRFQGSQARNVIIIVHQTMRHGLNREWVYTAASRARERVFLLHNQRALTTAIERQQLPGANPMEKARLLIAAYANKPWATPFIPEARSI